MTIYRYIADLPDDARVQLLGEDSEEVRLFGVLGIPAAAALDGCCPAQLAAQMFGDGRGCEAIDGRRPCRECAKRFLSMQMPKAYP